MSAMWHNEPFVRDGNCLASRCIHFAWIHVGRRDLLNRQPTQYLITFGIEVELTFEPSMANDRSSAINASQIVLLLSLSGLWGTDSLFVEAEVTLLISSSKSVQYSSMSSSSISWTATCSLPFADGGEVAWTVAPEIQRM